MTDVVKASLTGLISLRRMVGLGRRCAGWPVCSGLRDEAVSRLTVPSRRPRSI